APTTVNGIAAAELRSRTLGRLTARAMAMSSSYTASDELTLYIRPTPKDLGVLVPAYFSAGTKSPWVDLIYASKVSYPDVAVTAIVKPATGVDTNGIVTAADADLSTNITDFTASANHKVIAYVSTISGSGTRSVADIKAIIDSYISYYPSLNGFFLDEMGTGTSQRPFYSDIYTYIKGLAPTMEVIGNPGTFPDSSYAELATMAADVLVTFEGNTASYQNIDPQPSSTWVYSKPNSAQAMLVHSASTCTAMQEALKTAAAARTNTGWVYVTDQPVGSPWSALPSYWTKLLGTVDARNKNRTLPAC
ncbi:MAG: spherulation-specific family 4 protein, partial [Burkholderiaceae bacterium]|nr:spherulation-specific family 4 protein [Burkholderiaceae bacterium]